MIVHCPTCKETYSVHTLNGDELRILDRPEWRHGFPCITSLCEGRMQRISPRGPVETRELPLTVFYRALMGMGPPSPDEPATLKDAIQQLSSKRVVKVDGYETGSPKRVILKMLTLEDGTRMHFAASSKGACLYYIEEAPNAHEDSYGSLVEGGEETGRSPPEAGQRGHPETTNGLQRAGLPVMSEASKVHSGNAA